jgi:hypothetical protein
MDNEFNLERTIAGEPIETEAGTPVEFVAYRPTAKAGKQLIVQAGNDIFTYYKNGSYHDTVMGCAYDLRMKSVVKQIDWAKLPIDTRITLGLRTGESDRYFSSFSYGMVNFYRDGTNSKTAQRNSSMLSINPSNVQIAPDNPWAVLLGGNCPIPDGLEFEYMTSNDPGRIITSTKSASEYIWTNYSVYAYRLTGKVLDGWEL